MKFIALLCFALSSAFAAENFHGRYECGEGWGVVKLSTLRVGTRDLPYMEVGGLGEYENLQGIATFWRAGAARSFGLTAGIHHIRLLVRADMVQLEFVPNNGPAGSLNCTRL